MNYGYFFNMKKFAEVVEMADALSADEQENLVEILQHRLAEQKRAELLQDVEQARREFKSERCRPASVKEIMKKVLA
ncbi:MAG: hypothetical protein ACR2H1_12900 [Limisphaerales bacterium]